MFMRGIKTKVLSAALGMLLLATTVSGCSSGATSSTTAQTTTAPSSVSVEFDSDDLNTAWSSSQAAQITLGGDQISFNGAGAVVKGNTVTIQSGGLYVISGILNDGQIIVDSSDDETVRLVLNGAQLTCLNSAPIYVKNAEKTVITLAEGSTNSVSDGAAYTLDDADSDEPNAAVFSKDDLTINGLGTLTVDANYNHGISSKDDLKITGGNITIDAAADGLRGKDCVAIKDGEILIKAQSDGIQSSNSEDSSKGFVYIEGGNLQVTAEKDGIQAESSVLVKGGDIAIVSGGGSPNSISQENSPMPGMDRNNNAANSLDTESTKGIKAGVNITIDNGGLLLDTADDAIHSNDSIVINGGVISITSGDDAVHSDTSLVVNSGDITVNKSYEALESAAITINNGTIHLTASDDGINTSGGNDGSSINGRPGQNNFDASDGSKLDINGGYIYINAQGDGIDVNGDFTMNDGQVIVNGPTNDGNGALDYNGGFVMNGGFLVAAGSAGMAQAPGSSSPQASLKLNLGTQAAGTLICIKSEDGEDILTFAPAKTYASLVVSSPKLKQGSTYTVYVSGNSSGTVKDGLYSGGTYTPGTQVTSLKISSSITEYGQSGGLMPGGPMGRSR